MKPMLAATVKDVEALRFPLFASPKLDGVRATVRNGMLMSRSLKPIPNLHTQQKFRHLESYDGELIVGSPTAADVYRRTVSGVMSVLGQPEVRFMVFDHVGDSDLDFMDRITRVDSQFVHEHSALSSVGELLAYESRIVGLGYEGVILRGPYEGYKNGRSTLREQGMMKLKRFVDDEGVVVGFEELMHNANPATINELGHTAHSSHQENMVPAGRLGALVVKWREHTFRVGTGFDDATRLQIWRGQGAYLGQIVKFKYLAVGMKDLPRHPVFLGWRHPEDL